MGILSWILFGLIVGALARVVTPTGKQGGVAGIFATMVIGIVGAVVGGFIGTQLGIGAVTGFNLISLVLATVGAVLLLLLFHAINGSRDR
ncbi:MAG: GlsB/YeaQ/YmgE family stress response membrane protein [Gammaproteobacteria bacterium]|nr:GlsB/YeaQ/YmgE family stress response membrane protein [Gammaproteobacteria bacterium]